LLTIKDVRGQDSGAVYIRRRRVLQRVLPPGFQWGWDVGWLVSGSETTLGDTLLPILSPRKRSITFSFALPISFHRKTLSLGR
jgi:hypothetical protein